jgi:NAD(P)-dependent dehydrogenase (short-subunit alcohol dehydrogenase family)
MTDLSSYNYVILGASGGIGTALARRLKAQGANLLLAARGEQKLAELAEELSSPFQMTDACDYSQVQALFETANQLLGPLEGVAHCVGSILIKPVHLTTPEEWASTITLNLTSAYHVVHHAAKAMLPRERGSIALVSSVAATVGLTNHEAIAAAKAGIIGLTRSAAASYASRKIRVNCVAPGLVNTPLASRFTGNEASLKASTAMHPLGRIGEANDVASALAWFLDPEQSWVTGQVLNVDGGMGSLKLR